MNFRSISRNSFLSLIYNSVIMYTKFPPLLGNSFALNNQNFLHCNQNTLYSIIVYLSSIRMYSPRSIYNNGIYSFEEKLFIISNHLTHKIMSCDKIMICINVKPINIKHWRIMIMFHWHYEVQTLKFR